MTHEENNLFDEANMIEHKMRIDTETHMRNVTIAETLRELLNDSLKWPVINQLEAHMRIGEHCGIAGIQITSITCEHPEFERRKENYEL